MNGIGPKNQVGLPTNNQTAAVVAKGNRRSMEIKGQTHLDYMQTIETLNASLQQQNKTIQS